MEIIENKTQVLDSDNHIYGDFPVMNDSKIIFYGKNNILYCDGDVTLENSIIEFGGSNSIIYLSNSSHKYKIYLKIFNNSTIYIGNGNYFNETLNATISEETNLFIGNDCMFSTGVWLLTADPHLIYDIDSLKRLNFSKSIYIGDHVWIGKDSIILKGTEIDSGSIIGASSVVTGNSIENNAIYAGNPAKIIKSRTFWDGASVHKWTHHDTELSKKYDGYLLKQGKTDVDKYIYEYNENSIIDYNDIDNYLRNNSIENRLRYLIDISTINNKNRFVHYKMKYKEKNKQKIMTKTKF